MPIPYSQFRGTDIPEELEPGWESPNVVAGWGYLFDLIRKLPEYQRTICAITACEMVLSQAYVSFDKLEGEPGLADVMLDAAYTFLDQGPLTAQVPVDDYTLLPQLAELDGFIDEYPVNYPHLENSDYYFIRGYFALGMLAQYGDEKTELPYGHPWSAESVRCIISAVGLLAREQPDHGTRLLESSIQHEAMTEFTKHWWARCRARLAWRTATTDVLSGRFI